MCNSIYYPQESAPHEDFAIEAKRASEEHELRALVLRDRERVNRNALLGGTVRRAAKSSGQVAQRAWMLDEAKRDIGL